MSGLFVAAITITFVLLSKPSISVSIWFNVCSCSWCHPVCHNHLFLPIASISSINIIAFHADFALLNRLLTFAAPIPTNISINSEPDTEKNGTDASPATALAKSVFQLPGCQYNNTHFGCLAHTL